MHIKFKNVSYRYNYTTPMANYGLDHISFEIEQGTFNCITGHTGSGKSTLLQHFNALLLPASGEVTVPGGTISAGMRMKPKAIKRIRQKVGLVFQFPEHQLFEATVLKDIMFGPKSYGASNEEAEEAARSVAELVGLDEALLGKSPFELSSGWMRRVAIAGILAMDPEVVVLDEPTVGLDPRGRGEILEVLVSLQKQGKTIIVATHDMDLVAEYGEYVIVLRAGKKLLEGTPVEVFRQADVIREAGVYLPTAADVFAQAFSCEGDLPLCLDDFVARVVGEKEK